MKTDEALRVLRCFCLTLALTTVGCAYIPTNDRLRVTLMPYAVECHVDDVPAAANSIPLFISIRNISHTAQDVEYREIQRCLSIDLFMNGQAVKRKAGGRSIGFASLRADNEESRGGIAEGGPPSTVGMGERARYVFHIESEFDLSGPGRYLVVVHYCYDGDRELLYIPGSASFSIGDSSPDPIKWHNP